jgi:hypothetical protein
MGDRKFQPTQKKKEFEWYIGQMGPHFKRHKFRKAVLAVNQHPVTERPGLPDPDDTSDDDAE